MVALLFQANTTYTKVAYLKSFIFFKILFFENWKNTLILGKKSPKGVYMG